MSRLIPAYMRSLRARLVIAFALIVAVALLLVLATLPTLLDGYFAQQAKQDLLTRTGIMRNFVVNRLFQIQHAGEAAQPILQPTEPLTASQAVVQGLGTADEGFVRELTKDVALANVRITIADATRPDETVFMLDVAAD